MLWRADVFLLLTAGDVCFELMDVGPCQAETPRWYFNSMNNKCQQFVYGGCGGNQNNFQSEDMCNTVCPGKLSYYYHTLLSVERSRTKKKSGKKPEVNYTCTCGTEMFSVRVSVRFTVHPVIRIRIQLFKGYKWIPVTQGSQYSELQKKNITLLL